MKKRPHEHLLHAMKLIAKKVKDAIKAFTLIELLISIGIVAVLSTATFMILNPVEIFRQTRDASRLASLDSLKKAITIMQTQKGFSNTSLGVANVLYVSLPDATPSLPTAAPNGCPGLNGKLPVLPGGWNYHCVSPENLAKSNGEGWIPIDVSEAGLSLLPLDPLNKLNDTDPLQSYFYVYAADTAGHFEVNAKMESIKYGLGAQ